MSFPIRADAADTSRRDDPVSAAGTVRLGVTDGAEGEAYSAAIMFDFKSMLSAFATPAP